MSGGLEAKTSGKQFPPPPHREIRIFKSGKTVLDESGVVIHKNWYEILPATWLICPGMQVSTLVKKKKVEGCVPICREYRSYQGSRVTTGKKKKKNLKSDKMNATFVKRAAASPSDS